METDTANYALHELDILSSFSKDKDNRPIIEPFKNEILALCEAFGKSGQSGGSAPFTAKAISQAIEKLLLFQPICAITGIDKEWNEEAMDAEFHPDILFAWGNFDQAKTEVGENMVNKYGHKALCYLQLKDGSPRHLLYCKHKHRLVKFFPSKYLIEV
jgi:hypothetical protein